MTIQVRFRLERGAFTLDADLEIPDRGLTAVFGPSGSGKTTLLRCMAGLERAPAGLMRLGNTCWQDAARGIFVPPHRRHIGFVFQDTRLFPHRSVRGNLEYGLHRVPKAQRRIGLDQAVAWMGLDHLVSRSPINLSGGERQRVAIARALLTSPQLLLMDEPLASLDDAARKEILPYLEHLRDVLATPTVYVSHNLEDVTRLADQLVLLTNGRIGGQGPVTELASRLDLPIAHGEMAGSVLEAHVVEHDDTFHLTRLAFAGGELSLARQDLAIDQRVRVRVLARDVSLTLQRPEATSILNVLPATVAALTEESPSQLTVRLELAGTPLLARITRKSAHALDLQPGKPVYAQVKSVALLG